MLVLPSLFAAAAITGLQPGGASADAAESFVRICVATGGDRTVVAELAQSGGWSPIETAARDGVVWSDAYRAGETVAAVYLTPATDAPPNATAGLPVILAPSKSHCLVAVQAPQGAWRQAVAALDATEQLVPFPEALQPADGAGAGGAVRYYSLVEERAVVTIREHRPLGVLEIMIVRGLPHETDQ